MNLKDSDSSDIARRDTFFWVWANVFLIIIEVASFLAGVALLVFTVIGYLMYLGDTYIGAAMTGLALTIGIAGELVRRRVVKPRARG